MSNYKLQCFFYRDDGLAVTSCPPNQLEDKRDSLVKIFRENGLKITTLHNIKICDFLDVRMDLTSGTTRPFRKKNDQPLYINTSSNHPPSVLKSVPKTVETRISMLSSTEEIFEEEKMVYQRALQNSGYRTELQYRPSTTAKKGRKRMKKIVWFNPPFSKTVTTNVGQTFLSLIDRNFPKGSNLAKICNRSSIKVSYATTKNFSKHIDTHNKKLLAQPQENEAKLCNCRRSAECPVEGKCLQQSVIYKAEVLSKHGTKTYIGMTERAFKQRYTEHKQSLPSRTSRMDPVERKKKYEHKSELSAYAWKLHEEGTGYKIKWKIHSKAYPYRGGSRRCDLCLSEKLVIALSDPETTLNSRSELTSKCRHKWKYSLRHCKK